MLGDIFTPLIMSHEALSYQAGIARMSSGGIYDQGDDAGAFYPKQRLAVALDGIGGLGGHGGYDLRQLEKHLPGWHGDPAEFKATILKICNLDSKSVGEFCQFPEREGQEAVLYGLGDCELLQVRQGVLTVLSRADNLWAQFCRQHQALAELDHIRDEADIRLSKREMQQVTSLLKEEIKKSGYEYRYAQLIKQSSHDPFAQFLLMRMISRAQLTFSLRHSPKGASEKLASGIRFQVLSGDRYLLCSDGIYNGVLKREQILEILTAKRNPNRAAEALVEASNAANVLKCDDRLALVIDVGTDPQNARKNALRSPGKRPRDDRKSFMKKYRLVEER